MGRNKKTDAQAGEVELQRAPMNGPRGNETTDAIEIFDKLFVKDDEMRGLVENARVNSDVAQQIYDLRLSRAMTQAALARLVKTTLSVISRLEDADYEGHSLTMLKRIADALGAKLSVSFESSQKFVQS